MMQHRLGILILILSLFAAMPTSKVWACGNGSTAPCEQGAAQKSCCAKKRNKHPVTTDTCAKEHPGQSCPGSKGGGCHCPCGTTAGCHTGGLLADFPLIIAAISGTNDATKRQAFYFALHMPEAVYLPISNS
jgi:hypothetical protein